MKITWAVIFIKALYIVDNPEYTWSQFYTKLTWYKVDDGIKHLLESCFRGTKFNVTMNNNYSVTTGNNQLSQVGCTMISCFKEVRLQLEAVVPTLAIL